MAFSDKQELVDSVSQILSSHTADGVPEAAISAEASRVVAWLSRYVPRHVTHSFSANGTATRYPTTGSLTGLTIPWVTGTSSVDWIEHPTGDRPRTFLDTSEWWYYPSEGAASATHIEFMTAPASGSSNLVLGYSVPWSVTDATSNVPEHLQPGFEYALACTVCRIYAAKYGHSTSNTMDGDSVNYGGKPDIWTSLARAFCGQASAVLGVDLSDQPATGSGSGPAGTFVEWDPKSAPYGSPLFLRRPER